MSGPRRLLLPAAAAAYLALFPAAGSLAAPPDAPGTYALLVATRCPPLAPWVGEMSRSVTEGVTARSFFYRVLLIKLRDACPIHDHLVTAAGEMHRAARIAEAGLVTEVQYAAKEQEITRILYREDARRSGAPSLAGEQDLFSLYLAETQRKLFELPQPLQATTCTLFGDEPRCLP